MKRILIVVGLFAGFLATPANASQNFTVAISGDLSGTTNTIRCNSGSGAACLSAYPGGWSSDSFMQSFNLALGAMQLVEGDNSFTYGSLFASGTYSGTIVNTGGSLTGRDLEFLFADSNCRSGALGCRDIRATASSFNVTAATAVPEPATWAMMLIGFGAIGLSLRRRRPMALQVA